MSITTYAELQTAVQSWLDNDNANVVAAIPDAITLAEGRLSRLLRVWEMECRTTTPLTPTNVAKEELGYYALPDDWGGHRSVTRTSESLLILYWRRLPALSDVNTSNWLLLKHPGAYLYGSVMELSKFAKSQEEAATWEAKFNAVISEIAESDWINNYGTPVQATKLPIAVPRATANLGRLEFINPIAYDDLEATGAITDLPDCNAGYFTVSAGMIRIWPKPAMP